MYITASSFLRVTEPKLFSPTLSRTFAYPSSLLNYSSRASSVLRWSHSLHSSAPLSLRPQIRAVAPVVQRFHRKIATMGPCLLHSSFLSPFCTLGLFIRLFFQLRFQFCFSYPFLTFFLAFQLDSALSVLVVCVCVYIIYGFSKG